MTEREVVAILQELGRLWHEPAAPDALGGFLPLTVISLRFGLMGGEPQSYADIEGLIGLPRQSVREVESNVIRRLVDVGGLEESIV